MSGLAPLRGHDDVRAGLARALRAGELPGSLLFHGIAGVGQLRLALWLAQLMLCEHPAAEPCGACRSCRMVLHLEHPDLHWFFPVGRPKGAGSPEKLADALEEARAGFLAQLREDPFAPLDRGELLGLYIQQMQTLRRIAVSRPAMGSRKILIVANAELLVPQEGSTEAANVLLKVLEEPPTDTTFVLTASDPDGLLPTIRSRLLPVRLSPLPEDEVARFLVEERGIEPVEAGRVARLAQGAIGRALGFLPGAEGPGPLEALRQRARALLDAALSGRSADRYGAALAVGPAGARGSFSDVLDFLAVWIRDLAAVAAGAPELVVSSDAIPQLEAMAHRLARPHAAMPDLLRAIDEARTLAFGNINPQLILAHLLGRMAEIVAPLGVASKS